VRLRRHHPCPLSDWICGAQRCRVCGSVEGAGRGHAWRHAGRARAGQGARMLSQCARLWLALGAAYRVMDMDGNSPMPALTCL